MFYSIKVLGLKVKNYTYITSYEIIDTEFTVELQSVVAVDVYDLRGEASLIPSGLITLYEGMGKSVPLNLARFYLSSTGHMPREQQRRFITIDQCWTDANFPDLLFGPKYYPCTLNQLDKMRFVGTKIVQDV